MKKLAPALLLLLPLCGCSLQQRVDATMAKIEDQFEQTKTWENLPLRTISWQQALTMMQRGNGELCKLRDTIEECEREEMSVYTQMIPGATYYSYFSSSLRDLTDQVNNNPVTSTVNINFNLPTLTQVPYRVYAAKAATFANIKAKEGKERELISSLYKHVRSKEMQQKQQDLDAKKEKNNNEGENPRTALQQSDGKWGEIAKLLGNSEARWVILPESMPHVRWEKYESKLDKLDPLVVCRFALMLEQARMAQYNIALRYIPTLNTSLYSPSLFTSSGGTYKGAFLDSDDTRLSFNLSYTLDTDLSTWFSYKHSKDRYTQTKQDVAAQLMDYRNKLALMRQSYADYKSWVNFMHKRLDYLRNTPSETAEAYLQTRKEIADMEKELLQQETQAIETEAALILQYGLID